MGWTFYNSSGEALTSFGPVALTDLDIDGGTDVGEAIVDADLFIIDNGAGGTNVKTAASRIVTYVGADTDTRSGVAKAWVQWEQTGLHGITGSYNVECVDDGGSAGNSDIVWTTAFSNTNYAIVGMTVDDSYIYHAGSSIATTGITTVSVTTASGSGVDKAWNHIVVFGDQ